MPFALVETVNARGCKELSVVPGQWLRDSRSGNIVLWPNAKSITEQEQLLRDENSCPKKSWLKYKCTVKRNPISSFAEAKTLLEELSGASSSDVGQLIRRKRKHRETENFQKMLVLENTPRSLPNQAAPPPTPIVIEVRGSVRDEVFRQETPPPPPPPTVSEENVQTVQYETCEDEDNIETVEYVYETVHEPDALVEAVQPTQECEITKLLHQILHRLDRLEKRTADVATQNEFILDAVRKSGFGGTTAEEPPSFSFDPIKHEQEVEELELKLADDDFKSKMVKWLRLNVSGDCADNRMLCVLDMLFSKEFQTKCTWTGASRKGPKVAIMPNRNILQLFQQIGSDESEVVTQRKLASFFMKKLKNSLKRLIATGVRQGTRHVRRRKADEQEVKLEADADGSIIASSNVLNGQADNGDNSCSEPESEEYVASVVDSTDALDHADIPSDLSGPNDACE